MKKTIAILLVGLTFFNCKDREITEDDRSVIMEELSAIRELNQTYAGLPPAEWIEEYGSRKALELHLLKRDSVKALNHQRIKKLYEQYGFLGHQEVGGIAAGQFWVAVQDADHDVAFQQRVLNDLGAEIETGNLDKTQYAMLEDRVNINLGRPQRFGTQLSFSDEGQAVPKIGLVDESKVEAWRAEYNLPPFKDYYNQRTIGFYEMNRQKLMAKGITAPILYQ